MLGEQVRALVEWAEKHRALRKVHRPVNISIGRKERFCAPMHFSKKRRMKLPPWCNKTYSGGT